MIRFLLLAAGYGFLAVFGFWLGLNAHRVRRPRPYRRRKD